jgi:hypothetical protein
MIIPDHSTKTRQVRIIHEDNATVISAPNEFALFWLECVCTQYAIRHGKNVYENGI